MHVHQHTTESYFLDQYLKDRNIRYDAKDFYKTLKEEMKTKDKISIKAEPYNRPEEDEEAGSSIVEM